MSATTDCYKNIIGLSRSTCQCWGTPPADYDVSDSDFYIDGLTPLNKLHAIEDCDNPDMWTLMDNAKQEAIRLVKADILASILKKFQVNENKFDGNIGTADYTNSLHLGSIYNGVRIATRDMVSGKLILKSIGLIFTQSESFNIYLYNSFNELLYTFPVSCVAGTYSLNNFTPIELPLHSDLTKYNEYFLVYAKTGNKPMNNSNGLCCSNPHYFNLRKPSFKSHSEARYGWQNFAMVGSVGVNNLTSFHNMIGSCSGQMNGLIIGCELKCDINDSICLDNVDFTSDPLALTLAQAVRLRAGVILVDKMFSSNIINFDSMCGREQAGNFRNEWIKEYNTEYLPYLSDNWDMKKNDCFICRDSYGYSQVQLKA